MKHLREWLRKNNTPYAFAVCAGVVLYFILANLQVVFGAVGRFLGFFSPVFLGAVIAYILNPLVRFVRVRFFRKVTNEARAWKISVAVTVVVVVICAAVLVIALVPQVLRSVVMFLENLDYYILRLQHLIGRFSGSGQQTQIDLSNVTDSTSKLLGRLQDYVSGNFDNLISTSTNLGTRLMNFGISFIIAIYLLNDKKRILIYAEQFFRWLIPAEDFDNTASFWNGCNQILIRYLICEIIDACIVGVSNFIYMLISGSPYSVLISVVVGVTNLAPTFGPIVGGVIGTLILLLADPTKALYFIIFTNILQTIDGYVIKPRMYGDTLGIPPILILISIIVGGRMFGVPGILLGIPFAAILDYAFRKETYIKDIALRNLKNGPARRAEERREQEAEAADSGEKPEK